MCYSTNSVSVMMKDGEVISKHILVCHPELIEGVS